ncbi:MAG: hypothetical protein KGM24_00370 [Elusimicrobia bacterium]|nr:hypothetical protein [Elusimicrobiota bacterium]
MKEFSLVLERKDLEDVFSRLATERDWHRLAERLSQFKKLCAPCGVDLVLRREKRDLRVCFASLEHLHAAIRALAARRGYVQKSFAAVLQEKSARVVDRGCLPPKLRETQVAILKEALARDLGVFGRVDIEDVLVDAPVQGAGTSLMSAAAAALPSSLLVTGEGGSGKTTLLYKLLSRWPSLGRAVSARYPVYLPAKHLHFEWGRFSAAWELVPGVEPYMVERLTEAFEAGRLVLMLDGLDENPACTDFTNPAVLAFWRAAARNVCVLTLLPNHYESHLKITPLESLFCGRLKRLHVPAWGAPQYRELFESLSCAAGRPKDPSLSSLAGYLNKLSADEWQRNSNLIHFTPLTGLACANFFARNHARRLPKNEYELMEHMTSFRLQHEGLKGTSALSQETAFGLLMKLAWRAYVDGNGAKSYILPLDAAVRIVMDHYPFLEGRHAEALATLGHLPCLKYSPANTAVFMNQLFTDFLVARRVLHAFLSGDYRARREVMSICWQYLNMSRSYFQGIRCLEPAQKAHFFEVSRQTFRAVWQEYLVERSSALSVALAYVLQPMGFLDTDEARGFLRWVYDQAQDKGEFVLMSCAIGGAWGGDPTNLERYVERMRRDKDAARFNLNFYLFYRRQDRSRLDMEHFTPDVIERWEATADCLLDYFLRDEWDFRPLHLLYAFSLCNFLKTMGPGPFIAPEGTNYGSADARRRRRQLAKILDFWRETPPRQASTLLKKQMADLLALSKRMKLVGGDDNDAKQEDAAHAVPKVRPGVPAQAAAEEVRKNAADRHLLTHRPAFGRGTL